MPLYRWDLDKSYIETDFESVRGLIRAATESPEQKKTVPGAPSLMRALAQQENSDISVLSGSPEQLRSRILSRFQLDNIPISSLLLKDSVRRIKHRQFRDIRGQIGFKLQALLRSRLDWPNDEFEVCFGDDVELDALIYLIYSMCLSKEIDQGQLVKFMKSARAYDNDIKNAVTAYQNLPKCSSVSFIFIRVTYRKNISELRRLSSRVIPVHSWSQASFVLHNSNKLSLDNVRDVLLTAKEDSPWLIANLVQDLVRMSVVDESYIESWPLAKEHFFPLPGPNVSPPELDFNSIMRLAKDWH